MTANDTLRLNVLVRFHDIIDSCSSIGVPFKANQRLYLCSCSGQPKNILGFKFIQFIDPVIFAAFVLPNFHKHHADDRTPSHSIWCNRNFSIILAIHSSSSLEARVTFKLILPNKKYEMTFIFNELKWRRRIREIK